MLFRRAQATSLFHHIIRGRPSCVVSDPSVELFMIEGCLIVVATLVPRKNMSCPKQWWKFASKWLKPMREKNDFLNFDLDHGLKTGDISHWSNDAFLPPIQKLIVLEKRSTSALSCLCGISFGCSSERRIPFLCLCQRLLVGTSLLPLKINYCLQFCAVECATRRRRAHFVAGNLRAGA